MKIPIQSRTRERGRKSSNGIATALGYFSLGLGVAEIVAPRAISKLVGIDTKRRNRSRFLSPLYGMRELTAGIGLLSRRNSKAWMWSRVAGDVLDLGTLAVAMRSKRNDRTRAGLAVAAVAGVTALDYFLAQKLGRGDADGEEPLEGEARTTTINETRRSIWVNRSVDEVYDFWRDFANFPQFMRHLESVDVLGSGRSRWRARGPLGRRIEWEAMLEREEPNRLLSWRSVRGSDVDNAGIVTFEPGPGSRGTLVRVELEYDPPGGRAGIGLAKLLRKDASKMVADDLRAFKQVMETGEILQAEAELPSEGELEEEEEPERHPHRARRPGHEEEMEEAELGIGANSRREGDYL